MLMDGASLARDTEHGRAVTAQLTRRHDTLEDAIEAGIFALSAADVARGVRRVGAHGVRGLLLQPARADAGATSCGGRRRSSHRLELLPDPMYRALEGLVELVVDGDYEELREASGDQLEIEDLRRRVEDECPEALVLPPREVYRVEAIAKSDEPGDESWAYFLDLWTENGPARLHLEGRLEEAGGRLDGDVNDIVP